MELHQYIMPAFVIFPTHSLSSKMAQWTLPERLSTGKGDKHVQKPRNQTPVAIYHGKSDTSTAEPVPQTQSVPSNPKSKKAAKLCLFCKGTDHYLSQCSTIIIQTADQIETWIAEERRCGKCERTSHQSDACTLKKACGECQEIHLRVLHIIAKTSPGVYLLTPLQRTSITLTEQSAGVYLKVVPVIIRNSNKSLHTHTILDDNTSAWLGRSR